MVKIGVIGAGISGLTTAFYLAKYLQERGEDFTVDIYEKSNRPGGTIHSCKKEGFLVEEGPNGFLDSKPSTLRLCGELGISEKLLPADESSRRRYILLNGKLILVPEKPGQFLKSEIMSFKGKIRLFCEGLIKKGEAEKDETIAEFGRRRIGREAVENLLDPMVTGIFAGDPESLSLRACFPRIWEMEQEYSSLTKALMAIRKKKKSAGPAGPGGNLTSFEDGTDYLIKKMAGRKELNVFLNKEVKKIDFSDDSWLIEISNKVYDVLVSAVPACAFSGLLTELVPTASEIVDRIPYSPMAVIGLGYRRELVYGKIDGFGFLIPHREKRRILGALFSSRIFPDRAPEDYELIQVMLGGARFTEISAMDDKTVLELALEELSSILGLNSRPDFIHLVRYKKAIPQYRRAHLSLLENLKEKLAP
ncbi:MAG: protoporphyrinogen oxidase, partial [Acidobacteriota bacterium]